MVEENQLNKDNSLRSSTKEPEDILSNTESSFKSSVMADIKDVDAKRKGFDDISPAKPKSQRGFQEKTDNKVILLMLASVVVIIIAVVSWFTWPVIRGRVFGEDEMNGNISAEKADMNDLDSTILSRGLINIDSAAAKNVDTDSDGLDDIQEQGLGLDINTPDTDGDYLSDRDEVEIYNTDPRDPDTDDDGFVDGEEVKKGYDPNGPGRLNDIFRIIQKK